MIYRRVVKGITVAAFLLCLHFSASAQNAAEPAAKPLPFVSPIFGDNMVLQRGKVNTIWGWSEPGDKVQVEIARQARIRCCGADRRWQVKIQPPRCRRTLHRQRSKAIRRWNFTTCWSEMSGCAAANPICR